MQSRARPVSSWVPNVTHEPNDSTLTCSPERPSRRYSIAMPSSLSSPGGLYGCAGRRHVRAAHGTSTPVTSTTRWVDECEYTHTAPPSPSPTSAPLARMRPATGFRFDAVGRACPHGHTVM